MKCLSRTMERWGGFLVAPRSQVRTSLPEEGRHDSWLLGALYVLSTEVARLGAGLATWIALADWGGVIAFGSSLGRAVLVPIVALTLAESVLGRARGHRRALVLVPMTVGALVLYAAKLGGYTPPGPVWLEAVLSTVVGLGWVAWTRTTVPVEEERPRA